MASKYAGPEPRNGDALIVVDVQNDFLPGGSLSVPRGDQVIPVLNRYIETFSARELPIFATRDWHPPNHCSFKQQGGPWEPHCVAGTHGAEFAPALKLPLQAHVVSKATVAEKDAYSGFDGTDLDTQLRALGVKRVFVGGLATDYCVLNTVRDALARDYQVYLLVDGMRAIDAHPGDGRRAEEEMAHLGATPTSAAQVVSAR